MYLKNFIYLCVAVGSRQHCIRQLHTKFSDFASRLTPGEAFLLQVLSMFLPSPNQITRVKRNILKSNIHKPKSASTELTGSTGDKEVRNKRSAYYALGRVGNGWFGRERSI